MCMHIYVYIHVYNIVCWQLVHVCENNCTSISTYKRKKKDLETPRRASWQT